MYNGCLYEENMVKKLVKHDKGLALIIDNPILESLGITEKSELQVLVVGDSLIIKPKGKKNKKRQESLEESANRIMDKYNSVFEKLAKS